MISSFVDEDPLLVGVGIGTGGTVNEDLLFWTTGDDTALSTAVDAHLIYLVRASVFLTI